MLVLASNSPRRSRLLSLVGWSFTTRPSAIDEEVIEGETPEAYVLRLSRSKAEDVAVRVDREFNHNIIVLAADTTVVIDGVIIGKPESHEHAGEILRLLRENEHMVYTGLAAIALATGDRVEDCCLTRVRMRNYTDMEIEAYIASGDPMDKAGAYAVQNQEFLPVESIDGCLTNVMGLPLCRVMPLLESLGMRASERLPYPCLYAIQKSRFHVVDHAKKTTLAKVPEPSQGLDQISCSFTINHL
jgi:septum formation protein